VGAEAAGRRRGDGPDGALGARRGPLGGRRQRPRERVGAVGEDRRALLPGIGDAHLTEDGGGAPGPSEPQCLAGRTLGTWLPYRTSL
jgi:hypothetical protein